MSEVYRPGVLLCGVDAPLDEANKERFCATLDQFLDQSHFIVITHSKVTMMNCNELYGITQQERGVSKLVNVEVSDVGDGGEIRGGTAVPPATVEEPAPPVIVTTPTTVDASVPAQT